jgi:hypothetical protein
MLQLATASSTPLETHRKLFIRLCAFVHSITRFATVLVTPKNSKCMGTSTSTWLEMANIRKGLDAHHDVEKVFEDAHYH